MKLKHSVEERLLQTIFLMITLSLCMACGDDPLQENEETSAATSTSDSKEAQVNPEKILTVSERYLNVDERPSCDDTQNGKIIFVRDLQELQYCFVSAASETETTGETESSGEAAGKWVVLELKDANIKSELASVKCSEGSNILKYQNDSWICAQESDPLKNLGTLCKTGDTLTYSNQKKEWECSAKPADQDTLGSLSCSVGQVPKMSPGAGGANPTWTCGTDNDADTLATLKQNCQAGSFARFQGGAWSCFKVGPPLEFKINGQTASLSTQNQAENTDIIAGSSLITKASGVTYHIIGGRDAHFFAIRIDGTDAEKHFLKFSPVALPTVGKTYYVLIEARNDFGTRSQLFSVEILAEGHGGG